MPRILLPVFILALMAIMSPAATNDLLAECSCKKCSARKVGKCGRCGRAGECGCPRIPSLRQAQNGGGVCQERTYGRPDLFYNYYVDPTCSTVSAQMYMAPRPVPALVGHTYYTYQPLMPHEFLYPHHRTYHRYYDCGRGLTRTKAVWYVSPIQKIGHNLQWLKLAR